MKLNERIRFPAGPEETAHAALRLFGGIAVAVTITSIVESYANLVAFGMAHGMTAWHGAIAPVAVDSFIVMGELMLFGMLLLRWRGKFMYAFAGSLVFLGFAMSVGGNVFRSAVLPVWAGGAVQAIWPITATAALTGCLIILKRFLTVTRPAPAAGTPPPVPGPSPRAPRPASRAARDPGLAAAREQGVQALAAELAGTAPPWPSTRELARDTRLAGSVATRRRDADAAKQLAAAGLNGGSRD